MGMIERKKAILMSSPHLATASGSIASFNTDMRIKLKECNIHFSPIQEGSDDPSPTNIRPITGRNGITITHCGKNIIDFEEVLKSWNSGYTKTSDSSYNVRSTGQGYRQPYVFSADDINISASGSVTDLQGSGRWRFEFLNNDGTRVGLLGVLVGNSSGMYQVPNVSANKYRLNFGTGGTGATFENIQVEIGTECTSYEPYSGYDVPISWQSEAGTLYGGYLDIVTGELVQTHSFLTLDENKNQIGAFYTDTDRARIAFPRGYSYGIDYGSGKTAVSMASNLPIHANGTAASTDKLPSIGAGRNNESIYISLPLSYEVTDVTTAQQWIANNPIQLVYKLATPITYQLTPQQIKTLVGRNNIWSDAGDVEVKYWTH